MPLRPGLPVYRQMVNAAIATTTMIVTQATTGDICCCFQLDTESVTPFPSFSGVSTLSTR